MLYLLLSPEWRHLYEIIPKWLKDLTSKTGRLYIASVVKGIIMEYMRTNTTKEQTMQGTDYDRASNSKVKLLPALFFCVSALLYGYMLLDQYRLNVKTYMPMVLTMIVINVAAVSLIAARKAEFDRSELSYKKQMPSEQKIYSMQKLFGTVVTISASVQFAALLTSNTTNSIILFLIPTLELCAAATCLDYFKYEFEDEGFPAISPILSFTALIELSSHNLIHMSHTLPMYALGFSIMGFASWAVLRGKDFITSAYNEFGYILVMGVVVALAANINMGINYITLDQGHTISVTVEDKEYDPEDGDYSIDNRLYVTSDDGYHVSEEVPVCNALLESVSVGDKVDLIERTSIFNVRTLIDPAADEHISEEVFTSKLGSSTRADIALLLIGFAVGLVFSVASIIGLDILLFLILGGLGFIGAAIWCFISGEDTWVWVCFGFFGLLSLYAIVDYISDIFIDE